MFTSGSPNSGQLQIGIALVLQDRFSNQAREASAQIRRLHHEAKVATNANLNAVRSMATQGAAIGSAALMGMAGAVKKGAEFVDTMTQVGAIAKEDMVNVKQLSDMAKSLGRATMFKSQDIASGMQYMAMAGMTTKEIHSNIKGAAYLAGAVKHDLGGKGGAADLMTNIMRMFQIDASPESAMRVADVLTTGVTRANMSLTDLAETIKYAGTTGVNLGASLEQIVSFAGVLGDAGIQGSMAGTAISNAYRYLTRAVGGKGLGAGALASLGLSRQDFIDANGGLIDMGSAMEKVAKASAGLDMDVRFNKFIEIFGVRGERGASVMMRSAERYSQILEELQGGSQGRATSIMEKRMESIAGGINKMVSTFENLQVSYTETIAPLLTPIFNTVAMILDVIRAIISAPVIGYLLTSFITLGTILFTVKMGLLALKATFKLTFNDSLVTFKNMIAVMQAGWKGATISAAQYAGMVGGIKAQAKAGVMVPGSVAYAAGVRGTFGEAAKKGLSTPGTWVAGYKQGARGTYWKKDPITGGITRTTQAEALVGARRNMINASGGVTNAASGAVARTSGGAFSALGRGLGTVGKGLGGLMALMGGPWGLGILAGMMILPPLLGKVGDLISSNKENTDAVRSNTELERQKLIEERRKNRGLSNEEQMILLIKVLQDLNQSLRNNKAPAYTMVVNVDGKPTIKKVVRETLIEESVSMGGK